eukprot:s514_g1.t1
MTQQAKVDGDPIPDRPLKRAKTRPKTVEEAEGIQKIESVPLKQEAIDDASKRCFARSQPTGCEKPVRCKEEAETDAGTLARMPHHTMAAPESVLRKRGQNYPPRHCVWQRFLPSCHQQWKASRGVQKFTSRSVQGGESAKRKKCKRSGSKKADAVLK